VWRVQVPDSLRRLSRPDAASYENVVRGTGSTFPHRFRDSGPDAGGPSAHETDPERLWTWLAETPATDVATLDFAEKAVSAERLGQDSVPDLLAISLSSTDAIGHAFGPYSLEQLDNLTRLDRELEAFFDFLDRTVGRGSYVVALTGDHGSPPMPEYARQLGIPAAHVAGALARRLQATATEAAARFPGGGVEAARAAARAVDTLPFVSRAFVLADLPDEAPADSLDAFERASQRPDRWTARLPDLGVDVRLKPYFVPSLEDTHGSVWMYDRHVPLLLAGPGVGAGVREERVGIQDLAPTLARLLGVPAPPDLDGRPLDVPFGEP